MLLQESLTTPCCKVTRLIPAKGGIRETGSYHEYGMVRACVCVCVCVCVRVALFKDDRAGSNEDGDGTRRDPAKVER